MKPANTHTNYKPFHDINWLFFRQDVIDIRFKGWIALDNLCPDSPHNGRLGLVVARNVLRVIEPGTTYLPLTRTVAAS